MISSRTRNAAINLVASGVFAWANLNDMALNTSKTKSILITTQQKFHRLNDHSLDVMINSRGGGILLGIFGGGVPPGSSNPDPISDLNMPFSTPVFRPGPGCSDVG